MAYDNLETIIVRLTLGVLLGAIIGFERSYHGRPAGLRTHALVCTSSSLLMLFTFFQWDLLAGVPFDTIRIDPTRMGQGIMTGIGFLGAGVIMKEKLSVRGLTTATSIWMTASIGIIVGVGFYTAAVAATILTVIILSVLGIIEKRVPTYIYSRLTVRCKRSSLIMKDKLYQIVNQYNFKTSRPSYQLIEDGNCFQYELTIHTRDIQNHQHLAQELLEMEQIKEFSITPLGN